MIFDPELNAINGMTFSIRMRQREEAWKTRQGTVSRSLPFPLAYSAPVTRPATLVGMLLRMLKVSMPHLRLKTGRARTREELQAWCSLLMQCPKLARPGFSIEVTGEYGDKIGKGYQEYFRCLAELKKLRTSKASALCDLVPISTNALSKAVKAASTLYLNSDLANLVRCQFLMVDDRKLVEALLRIGFECVERGGGMTRLQISSELPFRRRGWLEIR